MPQPSRPLPPPTPSAPSLIPHDVLEAYQQEVALEAEAELVRAKVEVAMTPAEPLEALTDESPIFLSQGPANRKTAASALKEVALFNGVSEASIDQFVRGAFEVQVPDGQFLFLEGDAADSFYVVIDGTLEILRRREGREVALRHFGRGEGIGLLGLFSGQVRAACARAIGDATVLEVPVSALRTVLEHDDVLHGRMLRFYQERILEGFLGSSRLFSDIDSIARARVIGAFKPRALEAGETLVSPGEVVNLMAVITHGALALEGRSRASSENRVLEVTEGEFLALTSAMSGVPTRFRIYAPVATTIALLSQRALADLLRDYPALRNLPTRLPAHGRPVDRDIFCGHTGVPGL